jgi:hypothetical protein
VSESDPNDPKLLRNRTSQIRRAAELIGLTALAGLVLVPLAFLVSVVSDRPNDAKRATVVFVLCFIGLVALAILTRAGLGILKPRPANSPKDLPSLPLRLAPSSRKRAGVVLIGLVFVVGGAHLVRTEQSVMAYLSLGFFTIATILGFANLFLRRDYLDITAGGLVFSTLFGPRPISWDDVRTFEAVEFVGLRYVGWDYAPSYRKYSAIRRLSKLLVGVEALMPNYGMKVDELLGLLNRLREQHAAA